MQNKYIIMNKSFVKITQKPLNVKECNDIIDLQNKEPDDMNLEMHM